VVGAAIGAGVMTARKLSAEAKNESGPSKEA
jgi:hypothetical protein